MEDQRKTEGESKESVGNEEEETSSENNQNEKETKDSDHQAESSDQEQIGIVTDAVAGQSSEEQAEGQKTINEVEQDEKHKKTIKNLVSLVIILSGIAIGSFFIDVVQFVSGNGYSERALKDSEVFVAGEKTWVAFEDPAVEVQVLSVNDEELEDCDNCDPTEVIVWLKRFVPTLISKKVLASSEEGQALIENYGLKTIPAFVFSKEIQDSNFYQGEARVLFNEKDDNFVLNATGLGIPVGKYLETPQISEGDAVLGNVEAPVKVVVFSDFQCPYCSKYFEQVRDVVLQYEQEVALVYKDLPLDFHPQAQNAALAARCAGEQGKFWEMASELYSTQDQWGQQEGKTTFSTMSAKLGLNRTQFTTCMEEEKYSELIKKDTDEAKNFGITGTPATFINGKFTSGVIQVEELKKMIDDELAN